MSDDFTLMHSSQHPPRQINKEKATDIQDSLVSPIPKDVPEANHAHKAVSTKPVPKDNGLSGFLHIKGYEEPKSHVFGGGISSQLTL